MTVNQFIAHLKTQEWELDYITNLIQNVDKCYPVSDFINVFSWRYSPCRSDVFWSNLHSTNEYTNHSDKLSTKDFIELITTPYKDSHPELFI